MKYALTFVAAAILLAAAAYIEAKNDPKTFEFTWKFSYDDRNDVGETE